MRRVVLASCITAFAIVCAMALGSAAAQTAAPVTLRLDGIGPLQLGMTRKAALATGWIAGRRPGCPLGGKPLPITYRITGPKAPKGVDGSAEFTQDRLRTLSFSAGVRTTAGVKVGQTSAPQMVARYRAAGLSASSRYDSTFVGTFVTVKRKGKQVIGGFAEKGRLTILGIPFIPLCE